MKKSKLGCRLVLGVVIICSLGAVGYYVIERTSIDRVRNKIESQYGEEIEAIERLARQVHELDDSNWYRQAALERSQLSDTTLVGASIVVRYGEGFDVERRFVKPYLLPPGATTGGDPSRSNAGTSLRRWRVGDDTIVEFERRIAVSGGNDVGFQMFFDLSKLQESEGL